MERITRQARDVMQSGSRGLLALCAGLAIASATAGVQPLQRTAAGHVATRVLVEGHGAALFNVDTGAGSSALYETMRRRMRLAPVAGARIEMLGAAGMQLVERYRLPGLSLAGVQATNLLVSGLPSGISHGKEVMGLLGRDVLSPYVVEFDLVGGRLGLHAPGTLPHSAHGWQRVPFRIRPNVGLIEFTAELGGAKVRAVLDTGSGTSFVNWHAAGAAGVSPGAPGMLANKASGGGATAHTFDFHTADFPELEIGRTRLGRPRLSVADLPVFNALHMGNAPAMIVGLDVLGDRRFVVDYPARQLLIERRPDPQAWVSAR